MPVRRCLACVLACVVFAGCSLAPTLPDPEAEATLPSSFDLPASEADSLLPASASGADRTDARRWWAGFDDTTLTALVDTALAANRDLDAARARLEELAARYRIARAPLVPSATANGSASRQSQPANTGISSAFPGGGPGGGGPDRIEFVDYSVSLGLSYELDFWGRIRSQKNAALSEFFATTADLRGVRLAVVSQTISTYAEVTALRQQVRLAQENVRLLEDRLDVTRDRYDRGLVTSFELYRVRQQYEQARANQPPLQSQLYDAQGRLAVLLGRFAGQEQALLDDRAPSVDALGPVPAGVPADLLQQRPDVMASTARLEASRQRIGAARARLLPSVSLTATGGRQSSTLEDLLDPGQWFTNFAASLAAPLFQGGALWAEVGVSKAQYRQQLATHEQTILTAFQEVKAALVAYDREQERYRRVRDQVVAAENTVATQRSRYARGIGDYLALLDAEQNLVQVRQREATARQALVGARLAVHRALGGSWTDAPPPDDPRLFQ